MKYLSVSQFPFASFDSGSEFVNLVLSDISFKYSHRDTKKVRTEKISNLTNKTLIGVRNFSRFE